jgi:hypothetical protein
MYMQNDGSINGLDREMVNKHLNEYINRMLYSRHKDGLIEVDLNDIVKLITKRAKSPVLTPYNSTGDFLVDERAGKKRAISRKTGSARYFVQEGSPLYQVILDSWGFYEVVFRNFYGLSNVDQIFQNFIKRGIDLDIKSIIGDTPLHWAARLGNARLIDLLLKHGACANIKNDDNRTAMMEAIHNDHLDCVKKLMKATQSNNICVLSESVQSEAYQCTQYFLAQGYDINKPDKYGYTPLFYAVFHGYPQLVALLYSQGANAKRRYKTQCHGNVTLFELAIAMENQEIAELLLALIENEALDKRVQAPELEYSFAF